MNKYIITLLKLITSTTIFAHCSYAAITDGKYGHNQAFSASSLSTPLPESGREFSIYGVNAPWMCTPDGSACVPMWLGTSAYLACRYTNDPVQPVSLQLYSIAGDNPQDAWLDGNIFGLDHAGFLHVSNVDQNGAIQNEHKTVFKTFISNSKGLNIGDSTSYTPQNGGAASLADLQAYQATTRLLGPGEEATPPQSKLAEAIIALNNKKAYGIAAILVSFFDSLDSDVRQAFTNLINNSSVVYSGSAFSGYSSNSTALSKAVDQLLPIYVGSDAILDIQESVYNTAKSRNFIHKPRTGKDLWVEPLYTASSQKDQESTIGYDMKARGLICGVDTRHC
ncbi:hypothetical protein Cyrtocomes_00707 [Candidatus Cyrtobacter comes]|uniref:Uncharacterized protein n=1 Tax=Candidatus Cyrtobacter comes TaxID=675776 RepID=A0ABU5L889_9RICK|nr:hypothetical protein [Candidatus Cyrtobacter comes]MDZ5762328.1 hypothetical protein [Candidatus Cyrtobacter comes]